MLKRPAVVSLLDELSPQKDDPWYIDQALYVRFETVDDYLYTDWEDESVQALTAALGRRPEWAVVVDVSGRAYGTDTPHRLVKALLAIGGGVAMDDYSDDCWTLEHFTVNATIHGRRFFQRPTGPQP